MTPPFHHRLLSLHGKSVTDLALTPDGGSLVSTAADSSLAVWNPVTGEPRRVFFQPMGPVKQQLMHEWLPAHAIALSPDGSVVALSNQAHLAYWSVETGKQFKKRGVSLLPCTALRFTPDGSRLLLANAPPRWLSDPKTRGLAKAAVMGLGLLAGGAAAVAGAGNLMDRPGFALEYDRRGTPRLTYWLWTDLPEGGTQGELQGVTDAAFSPDGQTLAIATTRGTVQLYDSHPPSREPTVWERLHERAEDRKETGRLQIGAPARSIGWVREGAYLVVATPQALQLWDPAGPRLLGSIATPRGISALATGPRSELLATGSEESGAVELWDLQTGQLQATLTEPADSVVALSLSANGHILAAGTSTGPIHTWHAPR